MALTIIGAGRAAWAFSSLSSRISVTVGARRFPADVEWPDCRLVSIPEALGSADSLLLIALPDDELRDFWLAHRQTIGERATPFHASGSLTASEVFDDREAFSLHPLAALPRPGELVALSGTLFVWEGAQKTEEDARGLAVGLAGLFSPIPSRAKPLYHAAAVFASNYVATLLGIAETLLEREGVKAPRSVLERLAHSAISAWVEGNLTGPVTRGDTATVERHLDHLGELDARIYADLGLRLLELALSKPGSVPGLQEQKARELSEILGRPES